jgi:hypothetical protein
MVIIAVPQALTQCERVGYLSARTQYTKRLAGSKLLQLARSIRWVALTLLPTSGRVSWSRSVLKILKSLMNSSRVTSCAEATI